MAFSMVNRSRKGALYIVFACKVELNILYLSFRRAFLWKSLNLLSSNRDWTPLNLSGLICYCFRPSKFYGFAIEFLEAACDLEGECSEPLGSYLGTEEPRLLPSRIPWVILLASLVGHLDSFSLSDISFVTSRVFDLSYCLPLGPTKWDLFS